VPKLQTEHRFSLSAFLDYFIPRHIQMQPDSHRRARMFMLSHVFGPFLGNVIPLYLHFVNHIAADYRFWTFLGSVTIFWAYPFALRQTGRYQALAFISVQNLAFCILWACYSYGGILSPFLPWALTMPVLAFLYLPATGMIRNVLLVQIYGSFAVFAGLVIAGYPFPAVDLSTFQLIGMISIISASIYVSMMALYFANVFREQGAFERELGALVATADNLRNLTLAAQQASAAKADFVASMSHELRTPLNAVIGYSQLLLEDAMDEGNDEMSKDLEHIYGAGTHLLRLVDDILDFSKIEAGKMVSEAVPGLVAERLSRTMLEIAEPLSTRHYDLQVELPHGDATVSVDWSAVRKAVSHLVAGVATSPSGGCIPIAAKLVGDRLVVRVTDLASRGKANAAETLFDIFADESDASSTKYGGVGISLALSLKFAQLIGGDIATETDAAGCRVFVMTVPVSGEAPARLKAA
jgi:signal transduction histidine kinase